MTDSGERKTIADLVAVMAALRTPVTGCPWDLEQSFRTIAPYTLEEAYEVADAIERGDMADLREELGDLLLQAVYHSRLAEEDGAFDFADVVDGIVRKMVRRHPHVFGDDAARSAGVAKGFWDKIKAEEKAEKAAVRAKLTGGNGSSSAAPTASRGILDDVPLNMTALTRSLKLQEKAAKVGFDWPHRGPVAEKIREELGELDEAIATGDNDRIEDEFGDLLFVVTNLARHLKVDPEAALRRTMAKFQRRFAYIEARLSESGRTPEQSTLHEMDQLWDLAKRAERA